MVTDRSDDGEEYTPAIIIYQGPDDQETHRELQKPGCDDMGMEIRSDPHTKALISRKIWIPRKKIRKGLEIRVCCCGVDDGFLDVLERRIEEENKRHSKRHITLEYSSCVNRCGAGPFSAVYKEGEWRRYVCSSYDDFEVLPEDPGEALAKIISDNVPREV